ncbi:sorting nexin-19 [Eudromia elegans]
MARGGTRALALGAALGWLAALPLLLDARLLAVLCTALAALGAWLGPRALAGRRLRLERFVALRPAPRGAAAERQLQREVAATVRKVLRDFVASWYRAASGGRAFEAEAERAMAGLAAELQRRMERVDRRALARRLLRLCGHHLHCYVGARRALRGAAGDAARLWREYGRRAGAHPATGSAAAEVGYARAATERLLRALVPRPHLETRTGRFVVVELVACNVLLPALRRAADPDCINVMLVAALGRAPGGRRQRGAPGAAMDVPAGPPPPHGDPGDADEHGTNEEESRGEERKGASVLGTPFPSEDLVAPVPEPPEEPLAEDGDTEEAAEPTCVPSPCPDILIEAVVEKEDEASGSLAAPGRPLAQRPSCLGRELAPSEVPTQSPPEPVPPPLSSSPPAPASAFSFEPLSSPEGPVVIQNLRITGTITAREHSGTGFHPYTLYTVKYETALEGEGAGSLQQMAYHTVNRRYREFLNLQTRLEEKPELRKLLKNIKGPKKLFPDLPFGNMDSDKVEARKSLLESFLKQLCALPEIANSEEVQEFLALNTDARIAFVKKPFVVSRIDKIVVNAIVDTLKTAFPRSEPQSPTEDLSESEVDGKPQADGKKANKSRLRFPSSKITPVLSTGEAHDRILYAFREGSAVSGSLSLAAMESFIQKQEKLLETMPGAAPEDEESCAHWETDAPGAWQQETHPDTDDDSETALADLALELLRLLLADHWGWLCTDSMQKVLDLLFGTLIQRWLEVQVINLTCTQRWVQYLQLLQESIWPGGVLPAVPKPLRTQEQKKEAAEQALQSLMALLPDMIQEILGTSKCRLSWNLVLESLGQPIINRHLVFCLLDILLEFLVLKDSGDEPETAAAAPCASSSLEQAGVSAH